MSKLIASFADAGLPSRLDPGKLSGFSKDGGARVLGACGQLGLLDHAKRPTSRMRDLCAAYGADDWKPVLQRLLQEVYPEILANPSAMTSKRDLQDAFAKHYNHSAEMQRKVVAFFVEAARSAGLDLGDDLRSTRTNSPRRVRRDPAAAPGRPADAVRELSLSPIEMLTHFIYDPRAMPAGSKEEEAFMTLLRFWKQASSSAGVVGAGITTVAPWNGREFLP